MLRKTFVLHEKYALLCNTNNKNMNINRRDFIKSGGMLVLGTLVAPSFLESCTSPEAAKAAGVAFGKNHFKVSDGDLKKVQRLLNHDNEAVTMIYALADALTARRLSR